MTRIAILAVIATLSFVAPAFGGPTGCCAGCDDDLDGVCWFVDNCQLSANPDQEDTDGDDCGNSCDADYDQSGTVGFADFGYFTANCFGTVNPLCDHIEPIDGSVIGFADFGAFTRMFGSVPGPSGTTAGTIACP